MVSADALLISLIVDAVEDAVAAYLKANMDDDTLLKFAGESVDILFRMNSKYKEYVKFE